MNLRTLKKGLLATSAVALFALGASNYSNAVDQTMNASFATAAGLTTAAGTDLDFGTWAFNYQDAETLTITIPPTLGGGAPGVPTPALTVPGASAGQDSVLTNTVAPASSGTMTVTSPIAGPVDIQGVVTTDFGANMSLGTLTYETANEAAGTLATTYGTDVVTIQTGGAPEAIAIGGTLTLTGSVPENTTATPALITVSLQF